MAVDERASPAQPGPAEPVQPEPSRGRRLAVNTLFFSAATGLSRVVGLGREVVAASYFGVSGPMSAFTIAFQVPNLMRALFADAALQGAFVPVFTELLEKGDKREAFKVASSIFSLITVILGSVTLVFIIFAEPIMKLFTPGFADDPYLRHLTVTMTRLMFPIVLLLALSGVVVGMLNSFEHFSVPALAPVLWNVIIIGALVGLTPVLEGPDRVYAYAYGVLGGTIVQFLLPLPWLRGRGGRFTLSFDWRNPYVLRILKLMLPVTIALGLINIDALINSFFGTLVNVQAPSAIDKAFRIYMLPQGIFSVAIATILFPTLSRFAARGAYDDLRATMANGTRQILLTLIPSAAIMAVLATPITRLVYQRGEFNGHATHLVSEAMVIWALSLPAQGASLLFSRTFFSLQRPWLTTMLAVANMAVNALISWALYAPLGVRGVVLGSVAGTLVMASSQAAILRRDLGGIDGKKTLSALIRILIATAALSAVSYVVWYGLDQLFGRRLVGEIISVGGGIAAGFAVYAAAVTLMRIDEAQQIRRLLASRLRRNTNTSTNT